MKTIFGIGLLLAAGVVVSYVYYRSRRKHNTKADVPVEKVKELSVHDIVAYFQSLSLKEGTHKPFVCTDMEKIASVINIPSDTDGAQLVLLGVLNVPKDEVKYVKLICASAVSKDLAELMGTDKMIILS